MINVFRYTKSLDEHIKIVGITDYIIIHDFPVFKELLLLDNQNIVYICSDLDSLENAEKLINSFINEILVLVDPKKKSKVFNIQEIEEKEEETLNYNNDFLNALNLLNNKYKSVNLPEKFDSQKSYFQYLMAILINQKYLCANLAYLNLLSLLSSKNEFLIQCNLNKLIPNTDLKNLILLLVKQT